MNLYCKYVKVLNNTLLEYLYKYDIEILYVNKKTRACLIVYVKGQKYAIPFRSNMQHTEGKVFKNKISKYGLDFRKAIPICDENLLLDEPFLLKKIEKEYYSKDENYMLISLKFEQYLKLSYFKDKYQTTNHEILEYAQKYYLLCNTNIIKVFNHKQEEVKQFFEILDYKSIYIVLDEFYLNIKKFQKDELYQNKLINKLEASNKNIIIIKLKDINE